MSVNAFTIQPDPTITHYLANLKLPLPDSHKGQNGKLMIIGGSELFHAASKWSLDVASRFVDMVFYSSIPANNQLIQQQLQSDKQHFWNGIVVAREDLANYLQESDCILIGPGMERNAATEQLVNQLLAQYPDKKWVIDAGALQMINPQLLSARCIITPHHQEAALILQKINPVIPVPTQPTQLLDQLANLPTTTLLKGPTDFVISRQAGHQADHQAADASRVVIPITGGNAGMTKGGTGDILAGLVAALYCRHDAVTSAVVASYVNKMTGDYLFQTVGPFFNATDLANSIATVFWKILPSQAKKQAA